MAEVCITSGIEVIAGPLPDGAVVASDAKSVGVIPQRAEGKKCARSWRITKDVGSDPAYPDLVGARCGRDARDRCDGGVGRNRKED